MLLIEIYNDWRHFVKSTAKVLIYFGLSKNTTNKNAIYAKFCINGRAYNAILNM